MTDQQPNGHANGRGSAAPGPAPLALVVAIARNWRLVLATAVVSMLAAAVFGMVKPPMYTAQTTLFLSQGQTDVRSQLASSFPMAALSGGMNPNAKLVNTILGSRSLSDSVSRRTGPHPRIESQTGQDGSIRLEVRHRDPAQAARIANTYPQLLNVLVSRVGSQTNRQKEVLLQRQIASVRQELEQAEDRLVSYQSGRNAPAVDEQAVATLNAATQLQQRISEREVAVATLRRSSTPNNPQLRAALTELGVLRQQLQRLSTGGGTGGVLVPLRQSPGLKLGTARLAREFTKNEQIYIVLSSALAQAQLDLSNSLPVVTVVDPAEVPEESDGPGLVLLVAVAGVLGLVVGALVAVAAELVRNARRDPEHDPFLAVRQGVLRESPSSGVHSRI